MECIKAIDFLGNQPQTFIFKQKRYRTIFGGILSILTAIAIITLTLYFITVAIMRESLNAITSQTTVFNKYLELTSLPIVFTLSDFSERNFDPKIAYPIVQFWKLNATLGTWNITNLPLKQCEAADVAGYEDLFNNFNFTGKYCLNKTNKVLNLYGSFGDTNKGYSKFHIYISTCKNGSLYNPNADINSCATADKIKTKLSALPAHLYMNFPDFNVNLKNVSYPYSMYLRQEDFKFAYLNMNTYMYQFKKVYLNSDFGVVFENPYEEVIYTGELAQSYTLTGSTYIIKEAYGLVMIYLAEKAEVNYRTYIKLQSVAASIGGVANLILFLAKVLLDYTTEKSLLLDYLNIRQTTTEDLKSIANLDNSIVNMNLSFQPSSPIKMKRIPLNRKPANARPEIISYSVTLKELLLPVTCSSRYKDLYRKIENHVRTKLSLDNLLKESDEFERLKMYLFDSNELYVFNNYDRTKNGILNNQKEFDFNGELYKYAFQQMNGNKKLVDVIS
jgi:hypothetical protein